MNAIYYDKTQHANFPGKPLFSSYETAGKWWKMRRRSLICFWLSCFFVVILVSSQIFKCCFVA